MPNVESILRFYQLPDQLFNSSNDRKHLETTLANTKSLAVRVNSETDGQQLQVYQRSNDWPNAIATVELNDQPTENNNLLQKVLLMSALAIGGSARSKFYPNAKQIILSQQFNNSLHDLRRIVKAVQTPLYSSVEISDKKEVTAPFQTIPGDIMYHFAHAAKERKVVSKKLAKIVVTELASVMTDGDKWLHQTGPYMVKSMSYKQPKTNKLIHR